MDQPLDPNFWTHSSSPFLFNPVENSETIHACKEACRQQGIEGILWMKSSGTESFRLGTKVVGIKKTAFLLSLIHI